jgi:hypothetical protein
MTRINKREFVKKYMELLHLDGEWLTRLLTLNKFKDPVVERNNLLVLTWNLEDYIITIEVDEGCYFYSMYYKHMASIFVPVFERTRNNKRTNLPLKLIQGIK